MTKWLTAKQNVESWSIMPNTISFFERDILEFTMHEAQSRNSFQNKVACVHSVKRCTMVWSIGQAKGAACKSSFLILNNKLLMHRIRWIVLYWNIDSFTSRVMPQRAINTPYSCPLLGTMIYDSFLTSRPRRWLQRWQHSVNFLQVISSIMICDVELCWQMLLSRKYGVDKVKVL